MPEAAILFLAACGTALATGLGAVPVFLLGSRAPSRWRPPCSASPPGDGGGGGRRSERQQQQQQDRVPGLGEEEDLDQRRAGEGSSASADSYSPRVRFARTLRQRWLLAWIGARLFDRRDLSA
ncbi:MAG: hypothetical protein ACJ76D_03985 [Solirubrobacterales bacterium]